MVNYNAKKKEIRALVRLAFRILEIKDSENESSFYNVMQFESSVFSTTSSIDFNFIVGKDITEFLSNTNAVYGATDLKSKYDAYLEREVQMKIQFSNKFKWKLYSLD